MQENLDFSRVRCILQEVGKMFYGRRGRIDSPDGRFWYPG